MTDARWIGIDVSKATLDVVLLPDDTAWSVANAPEGWTTLAQTVGSLAPAGIVLEATGSYHAGP